MCELIEKNCEIGYLITLIIFYNLTGIFRLLELRHSNLSNLFNRQKIAPPKTIYIIAIIIVVIVLANFLSSPIFNSKSYSKSLILARYFKGYEPEFENSLYICCCQNSFTQGRFKVNCAGKKCTAPCLV